MHSLTQSARLLVQHGAEAGTGQCTLCEACGDGKSDKGRLRHNLNFIHSTALHSWIHPLLNRTNVENTAPSARYSLSGLAATVHKVQKKKKCHQDINHQSQERSEESRNREQDRAEGDDNGRGRGARAASRRG
jgi:hypothetical protein